MSGILSIEPPENFSFENTVLRLRRGDSDPINKWDPQKKQWRRIISQDQSKSLVHTRYSHEKKIIYIKILKGKLDNEIVKTKISQLLGFDDPFLKNPHPHYTQNHILKDYWSTALPGYSNLFEALIQIVIGQLVSTQVANQFLQRIVTQFGASINHDGEVFYNFPQHQQMDNKTIIDDLRKIGLSKIKSQAIYEIALKLNDKDWLGDILNPAISLSQKSARLTEIKGIGQWSADWFLFRGLRQFQVIPITDLAVRKALSWWWGSPTTLSPAIINASLHRLKGANQLRGLLVYKIMCAYFSQCA